MMQAKHRVPLPKSALLGLTLAVLGCATFFAGCKGNTTAAAPVERKVGDPPHIIAHRTSQSLANIDPSMSPAWAAAAWQTLVEPINSTHMPPATRAAVLFDDANLYLAVTCDLATQATLHDAVTLYLDPTGQGCEVLQISTDADGRTQCTWIRSSTPMQPLADGSPDITHPLDVRPNTPIPGLVTQVFASQGAWRLSLTLPRASLPAPMRVTLAATPWRFNVVRSLSSGVSGAQLQSNLAPIYVNSQSESPYRMAYLDFDGQK